ncbi:amino acid permease [Fastidiosibacter lacustris]|uniref:amino acid permease n=1 Tax=Fastidiosibacter lacustris TaxID=2056695 RepID=UPI000E3528F9|nr:aromatic amino acid transport family protein [Fastidiosibacter lacustris]
MTNNSLVKQLGCTMIVTGTEIGAGILALPIITAKFGFLVSSVVMLIAWCIMTYTALLLADISLSMPKGASFASIAKHALGLPGVVVTWISFLLLMYCISIAYISGASSAFHALLPNISQNAWALIFVVIFGTIVVIGTSAVDIINRVLLTTKLVFLLLVCITFLHYIEIRNLLVSPIDLTPTLFIAIPIIITSFTSHIIIPTLTEYLDKDVKALFRVIFIGSIIPLFLYFLWLISVLGVLPLHGSVSFMSSIFDHVSISSANVGDVLNALKEKITNSSANISMNIFTDISVITSYLGVSLALYHFNVDSYRLNRLPTQFKLLTAVILTFIIPLLVNLLDPNLFISAIGYVGVFIAVLLLMMPAVIAFKLTQSGYHFHYKISQFRFLWIASFLVGIAIIVIHFSI